MRKSLLIAAMTGLAFVGCTENDLDQSVSSQSVIRFGSPVISNQTKALGNPEDGEQKNKYSTAEHFSVYAVYHEGAYVSSSTAQVYFRNVDAGYNDTEKCWDTASGQGGKDYYWPKKENAKLTFSAYSPTSTSGTIGWTEESGFSLTDFTVEAQTKDQYDLMFSKRTMDKSTNTGGTSYVDPTDAVDINFEHALSSIVFTAGKDASYDGTTIKLKKITLQNVYSVGDYAQGLKDDASNSYQTGYPQWTDQETETAYVVFNNVSGIEITNTSAPFHNAIDNAVILLPQAFDHTATSKKVTVKIDYSIKTSSGEEIEQTNYVNFVTGNSGDYFTDGANKIQGWEIGKKYTYNIIFSFDKIYFSPEVADWTPVTVNGNVKF